MRRASSPAQRVPWNSATAFVTLRRAEKVTGWKRHTIARFVAIGATVAHEHWDHGCRKVAVRRVRGKWRLVNWPPSSWWVGRLDSDSTRPVIYHDRLRRADDPPAVLLPARRARARLNKDAAA